MTALSITQKRLIGEMRDLQKNKMDFAQAVQDEKNPLIFYFLMVPTDEPYKGGYYIGKIELPPEYPDKAGDFYMLTPNGRFEIDRKICLTNSGYHSETWTPSWTIRNMLLGVISIFVKDDTTGISHIKESYEQRKIKCNASITFNATKYKDIFTKFDQFVNEDGSVKSLDEVKKNLDVKKKDKKEKEKKDTKKIISDELAQLTLEKSNKFQIVQDDSNYLLLHFLIANEKEPYSGHYLGKLELTEMYPENSGNIQIITPNGKLQINKNISLEQLNIKQEVWTLKSIMENLINLFSADESDAHPFINGSDKERRLKSHQSFYFNEEKHNILLKKFTNFITESGFPIVRDEPLVSDSKCLSHPEKVVLDDKKYKEENIKNNSDMKTSDKPKKSDKKHKEKNVENKVETDTKKVKSKITEKVKEKEVSNNKTKSTKVDYSKLKPYEIFEIIKDMTIDSFDKEAFDHLEKVTCRKI